MSMTKKADVVIIGGGITGTAVLYELAKYKLHIILVEQEPDLAIGTTKANSAILHAGYDALPGSLKAQMNVAGNALYHKLKEELHLEIKWTGSLVVATNDEQLKTLYELKQRGERNGVPGLDIWDSKAVHQSQPNLSSEVQGALWAPTAGICWPFDLCLAFAENAVLNGAEIIRECRVTGFDIDSDAIRMVHTNKGDIETTCVVNAAGIHADEISSLAGDDTFRIFPRKGEYILFDQKVQNTLVSIPVFPTPDKMGKGIMVAPTIHGNVFIGPNAQNMDDNDKDNTAFTNEGMSEIIEKAQTIVPCIPINQAITEFAGVRAVSDTDDFILGPSLKIKGLFQAAGIQSPGLTAAPAIAQFLVKKIIDKLKPEYNTTWKAGRPQHIYFKNLDQDEKQSLIKENPSFGRVICRCETVTEGEIMDAIHRPVGARTVDGVKRRTRAGMGRCQGGFCGPRIIQILSRELHIPVPEVRKEMCHSYMYFEKDKYKEGDI